MKPVLILKTGNTVPSIPPERGDFEHWISAGLGLPHADCLVVDVMQGALPPAPESVSGIVVTGSAAMVTDRLSWSERTAAYLRQAVALECPVLGICYGHQLLAHALGGEVDFHPAGREIGTTNITLTEAARSDRLFGSMPATFPVQVSHKQSVSVLPPETIVLASNAFESFQAVRFGEQAWGVQFHPEFAADVMMAYLQERQSALVAEGFSVEALRLAVRATPAAASLLRNFAGLLR